MTTNDQAARAIGLMTRDDLYANGNIDGWPCKKPDVCAAADDLLKAAETLSFRTAEFGHPVTLVAVGSVIDLARSIKTHYYSFISPAQYSLWVVELSHGLETYYATGTRRAALAKAKALSKAVGGVQFDVFPADPACGSLPLYPRPPDTVLRNP